MNETIMLGVGLYLLVGFIMGLFAVWTYGMSDEGRLAYIIEGRLKYFVISALSIVATTVGWPLMLAAVIRKGRKI